MTSSLKNFMKGIGSVFDVGASHIKNPIKGSDADRLRSDWQHVGNDIKKNINKHAPKKS